MLWRSLACAAVCVGLMGLTGCDDGSSEGADMGASGPDGMALYNGEASAALGAAGNEAKCSTCHSNDGTEAGFSGSSMMDIAYRERFKGGGAPDLLAATNACVTGWMGGAALTADSAEWMALEGYLQSISDEAVTAANDLAPEVLADEAAYEAAYAGGDAAAGEAKFNAVCGVCHNSGLTVGPTAAYAEDVLSAYTVGRIAQKVRTSGPPPSGSADAADSTPGPMPFFEPDELSSEDLADIIAYLKS